MSAANQSGVPDALARCARGLAVVLELLSARLEQPASQVENLPQSPPPATARQLRDEAEKLRSPDTSSTPKTVARLILESIGQAERANRQLLSCDPPWSGPTTPLEADLERLSAQVRELVADAGSIFVAAEANELAASGSARPSGPLHGPSPSRARGSSRSKPGGSGFRSTR